LAALNADAKRVTYSSVFHLTDFHREMSAHASTMSITFQENPRLASQTRVTLALPVHPWSRLHGRGLDSAKVIRRQLSGPLVGDDFVADLLTFVKIVHSGAFDRTDMHENVLAAVVRLNEAETFLAVKPLHSSCRHGIPLSTSTQWLRAPQPVCRD
jgi:hypothetical protein